MAERLTGIAVAGSGKVAAAPDLARAEFTAQVEAATAAEAGSRVTTVVNDMIAAMAESGVAESDRRTAGMNFSSWRERPGRPPRHHASQRLSVRLRDLDAAGILVQQVLSAGGYNAGVEWFALDIEDREPHHDTARERAMDDARRKAEHLASLAGRPLGPVVAVSESAGHEPSRPEAFGAQPLAAAMPSSDRGVPVEAGDLEIEVRLAVEFTWGD